MDNLSQSPEKEPASPLRRSPPVPPEPYQYGIRTRDGSVERQPSKSIAEDTARAWVLSPLRTGIRRASVVRRRGWDGEWEVVASWTTPPPVQS